MNILNMSNINKSFFGVPVLKSVDFSVKKGEVHALLGENGAGKSTLMNILAGVYTKETGTVTFDGQEIVNANVVATEGAGIAFVHQELNLVNDLRVFENIFLRKEITNKLGFLNNKAMIAKSRELFESLGVDIDPHMMVSELDTGKKQLLEIAKSLFGDAKLLILDEPTTALNNSEIEHLFRIVNGLKAKGVSFIFISHKMGEIFTIADRYTVLRNGEVSGVGNITDIDPLGITKLMVGDSYQDEDAYSSRELGEPVLEVENLTGQGYSNITLSIKKGEIVGFTGLKGAGVSSFFQSIFGNNKPILGTITVEGNKVTLNSIKQAMQNKVAMIAANRKENSIIPDATLLENNYVAEHVLSAKSPFLANNVEKEKFYKYKEMLNIKCNEHSDMITSLSGGNQQKVIIGRWLNTEADILLMDNPTQGIDVGAKAEIYRLMLELSEQGKTILVNTLEIPEIMQIADRCAVFYHGALATVLDRHDINEQKVMLYATGAITAYGGNN